MSGYMANPRQVSFDGGKRWFVRSGLKFKGEGRKVEQKAWPMPCRHLL